MLLGVVDTATFLMWLGICSVFIGIVLIFMNISLRRLIQKQSIREIEQAKPLKAAIPVVFPNPVDRQKLIAAVSAAIATQLGTDINGLRIHSIRKIG